MIDVKQAVAKAKTFAADVLGISDILLEEVHSRGDHFDITLSFQQRFSNTNPMVSFRREYKTFEVNKVTGEVEGMSIREIA